MIVKELKISNKQQSFITTNIYGQAIDCTNFTDELIKVRNNFKKESDRALIILSCSAIDEILRKILEKKLINTTSKKEKLLKSNQPLSSFSSKIEICYRIGLISENLHTDLNILREIRNLYAHNLNDTSLEDKEMENKINTIINNCPIVEHNSHNGNKNPSNRRRIEEFIGTVLVCLNNMLNKIEKIQTISKEKFLYDKKW